MIFTLALFNLLSALIPAVDGFVVLPSQVIVHARLDPLVQPGAVSSHVHNVVGGNKFKAIYDPDDLLTSTCTSTPIIVDKSNYWAPALYHIDWSMGNASPKFTHIPSTFNLYYLSRPGPKNEPIIAFPKGFRMMAGSNSRSQYNASSFEDHAISYYCLDYSGKYQAETPWFPQTPCPDGIRAQVFFPSCWDGINPDSWNHKAHVSYPIQNYNGGDCPRSHPVHLVSLFYEQIFYVNNYPLNSGGKPTWAFSNGDMTGFSGHADFQNGWDITVLQNMINQCGNAGGDFKKCPAFEGYIDEAAQSACRLVPTTNIPNEPVGRYGIQLATLPGDNRLWSSTNPKPKSANPTRTPPWEPVGSNIDPAYQLVGCIKEGSSGRALTGALMKDNTMTLEMCVNWCKANGFIFAGTEYYHECYCGNSLSNGATLTLTEDKECNTSCDGNSYENCGGPNRLTLFKKVGTNLSKRHARNEVRTPIRAVHKRTPHLL